MPGKHAPESPRSFLLSVGRSAAGALAVLGVVVVIAVIAVNSRGDEQPGALGSGSPSATGSPSAEPTETSKPSSTAKPSRKASPDASPNLRERGDVTVQVLNGNGRTGAAGSVSTRLDEDGYDVIEPGNASVINRTIIYYDEGYEADAEELRRRQFDYVKQARVRPREPGTGDQAASIVVVIGKDQPA